MSLELWLVVSLVVSWQFIAADLRRNEGDQLREERSRCFNCDVLPIGTFERRGRNCGTLEKLCAKVVSKRSRNMTLLSDRAARMGVWSTRVRNWLMCQGTSGASGISKAD
jgi:hypothetical protein